MQKMELSYWWEQGDEKNKNKLGEWRAFADTKTLEQLFIFQIGTLNPRGINECSSFN